MKSLTVSHTLDFCTVYFPPLLPTGSGGNTGCTRPQTIRKVSDAVSLSMVQADGKCHKHNT